jgi:L-serine dehydratase
MYVSVFDIFSIGIGPSSSHTVGPMKAAKSFIQQLEGNVARVSRVETTLYGSLAHTGKGHGTHLAILMGLEGEDPKTIEPKNINRRVEDIIKSKQLALLGQHNIHFDFNQDLIFDFETTMSYHSNAMIFSAYDGDNLIEKKAFYSIGGGFIFEEGSTLPESVKVPYVFHSSAELIALCEQHDLTIAQLIFQNELIFRDADAIKQQLLHIEAIMMNCMEQGCQTEGHLPGGLSVVRRAPLLYKKIIQDGQPGENRLHVMNWLDVFAMAVNEENAAGGRVVTAPTNGAAGIIPALIKYYRAFHDTSTDQGVVDFLLTAGAICQLYKENASISGAEMGCQGEVGVASSMAAAGLAAARGADIYQVENAAEIAMEHNLGLTCDPVGGLVQIPCIERNGMGAVKAVNAASLAEASEERGKVSLDMVIATMREIGTNMRDIYKETSKGGLAVNVVEC